MLTFHAFLALCCLFNILSCRNSNVLKPEGCDADELNKLKTEIALLKTTILDLEKKINIIQTESNEHQRDGLLENFSAEANIFLVDFNKSRYEFHIASIDGNIDILVRDIDTKYIYYNKFTSIQIQDCGFKLQNSGKTLKFIINALTKASDSTKFVILLNNNELIIKFNIIEINDFQIITMKLMKQNTNKIDILMEHIKDLKNENNIMKNSFSQRIQNLQKVEESERKKIIESSNTKHESFDQQLLTLEHEINVMKASFGGQLSEMKAVFNSHTHIQVWENHGACTVSGPRQNPANCYSCLTWNLQQHPPAKM
eukprot:55428_1